MVVKPLTVSYLDKPSDEKVKAVFGLESACLSEN